MGLEPVTGEESQSAHLHELQFSGHVPQYRGLSQTTTCPGGHRQRELWGVTSPGQRVHWSLPVPLHSEHDESQAWQIPPTITNPLLHEVQMPVVQSAQF